MSNCRRPLNVIFFCQPERISGKEYTITSDVWSTGITLLELVQMRFPFPTDAPPIEIFMYITQSEVSSTVIASHRDLTQINSFVTVC